MNEIFDIEFKCMEKFSEHFDAVLVDDDYGYWESKETFHHEEEGLTFDYKYVVDFGCAYERDGAHGFYSLYIMPTKEFWNKKMLEDVMTTSDIDYDQVNAYDACMHGGPIVPLRCTEEQDFGENTPEPNEEILNGIASVYRCIDDLQGFYLDRPWNYIGTNGWDSLNHILHGTPLF